MASAKEGTCRLCGQVGQLQRSHIIPRSFYKHAKAGKAQLVGFSSAPNSKPFITNGEPKERLLCHGCEQHFSVAYERWGTRLFFPMRHQKKLIVKMGDYIKFKDFRYEDTYLFFLSILWRAGVSTLEEFKAVTLGVGLERRIAECLKGRTLVFSGTPWRVDNFIKLALVKLVDPTGAISQEILQRAIFGFSSEIFHQDECLFYFGVGGFLVVFHISANPLGSLDQCVIRSAPRPGACTFRAECAPIQELSQIGRLLNLARQAGMPSPRRA